MEQVNARWIEGLIILVANDVLSRKLQLKHFCNMLSNCMMSKTHAITKIYCCAEHIHWYTKYLMEKIYNNYSNVVLILNFDQLSSIDMNLFKTLLWMRNGFINVQKNVTRGKTANIKFSYNYPQNNFLNFLTL